MPDQTILVHIGYHKTGTSWLQSCLFGHPSLGFYPLGLMRGNKYLSGDKRLPKTFADYFIRDEMQLLSAFEDRTKDFCSLIHNLKIPDGKVGVLSNERLSGGLYFGGIDSRYIADRLHMALPTAKIFICIREQDSIILSSYFHYLRGKHGCLSLRNFIGQSYILSKLGFSIKHFCYDGLIEYYQKLFGVDRVLVLPYELFVLRPQEFIESITNFCCIESVENLPYSKMKNTLDVRYKIGMYFFRYLNAFSDNRYIYKLSEEAIRVVGKTLPLSFAEQKMKEMNLSVGDEIGDYFVDSNRRTAELIGFDLVGRYGYR